MTLLLLAVAVLCSLALCHGLHHLLAYTGNNAGAAANFDLTGVTDTVFSTRNGHFFFTEQYAIAYVGAQASAMTDARLLAPTYSALNADGFRITGFQQKAGVGGVPTLFDRYLPNPAMLPMNEEVQFQGSSGATQEWGWINVVPPGFQSMIPAGPVIVMEGTVTSFTPAANVWSGPQTLNLTSNPRGGVYAIIRATCQQVADTLLFRLVFPRPPLFHGRPLRPGWVAQNAVGSFEDVITQINPYHLGTWGWFSTVELPMVEVLATTSAAMTPIFRLWCVYLGGDFNLLNSAVTAASVA